MTLDWDPVVGLADVAVPAHGPPEPKTRTTCPLFWPPHWRYDFVMRTILVLGTLTHLALVIVLLDGNNYGGVGLWAFGTAAALLGMVAPFFTNTRRQQRWGNLFPGILLFTGWGSWLVSSGNSSAVNIWGIMGPVSGVAFLAGLLALSMMAGPPRSPRITTLAGLGHEETLPPGRTGSGRVS